MGDPGRCKGCIHDFYVHEICDICLRAYGDDNFAYTDYYQPREKPRPSEGEKR